MKAYKVELNTTFVVYADCSDDAAKLASNLLLEEFTDGVYISDITVDELTDVEDLPVDWDDSNIPYNDIGSDLSIIEYFEKEVSDNMIDEDDLLLTEDTLDTFEEYDEE